MLVAYPPADVDLKERVRRAYQEQFPGALVDVSDGYQGRLHVILVSRDFDTIPEGEREDLLGQIARQTLGDEAQRISLMLAYSPEELK